MLSASFNNYTYYFRKTIPAGWRVPDIFFSCNKVSKYHQPHLENTPGKPAAEDQKSKPAKKSPAPLSTVASESMEVVMESAEELPSTGKPYFCHYYHFFKSELS